MDASPITINETVFVELFTQAVPHASTVFWTIMLLLIGTVIFVALRTFITKLSTWVTIRFFDRFLNPGTCVEYKDFFGTVKKIAPTYVLIEKATDRDSETRIFRRIPILEFAKWHIDFYEQKCTSIACECKKDMK